MKQHLFHLLDTDPALWMGWVNKERLRDRAKDAGHLTAGSVVLQEPEALGLKCCSYLSLENWLSVGLF